MKGIKGYKAFNKDMTCRDMQYEIGKEYKMEEKPELCKTGYHFCKTIADCYRYYCICEDTIICEIRALGEIVSDGIKFCTNHILIVRKINNPKEKTNVSISSGYCNAGYRNTGNWNTGDYNSGYWNAGNWNTGIFCTEKQPKIKLFDKESDWTMFDWLTSYAKDILDNCPYSLLNL